MIEQTSEYSARFRSQQSTSIHSRIFSPLVAVLVAALIALAGLSVLAGPADHVPGQLLVQPKPRVPEVVVRALVARNGARQVGAIHQINVRVLQVPPTALPTVLAALQHNQNVQFAEPDYIVEPALTPNDPYFSLEWHLPKIQAPAAWDVTTGVPGVIIAILDSGIDATHPDLAGVLVPGWNFYDNNANTSDVTGHGTGVAGSACTAGNNGLGIAAPAWGCQLMPIRIADTNGYASTSMIAAGVTYAADHGARVANASFAISGTNNTLSAAAQYLQSKGGVFTVAAGNDATFDGTPDDPYMLRISATDSSDTLGSFSAKGNNIDLSAPGVNIVTTTRGGGYGYATGTSAAAPLVAGVAALMLSANPALTGAQVQELLKQTADDLGSPGWDPNYGWGRLNAYKAVQAAVNAMRTDTSLPTAQVAAPVTGSVVSNVITIDVTAADNVGVTRVECYLDGALAGTSTNATAMFSWDSTAYTNGSYILQARAYDAAGNVGASTPINVTVQNADTTPPLATIAAPSDGSAVSGMVSVSISASDNVGVTKVEWYLDGALAGASTVPSPVFSWSTTNGANGPHTLQAKAYDAAGNTGTSATVAVAVQNVVRDTTPPTAKVTSPTNGTTVGKSTSVYVVATDNVGVKQVDLLVDGKLYNSSSSPTPVFSWNTSKISRGSHTLQSVAYDAAGNSARSSIVTVSK